MRVLFVIVCLAGALSQGCRGGAEVRSWDFEAMGTAARVEIFRAETEAAAEGSAKVKAVFDSVNAAMSTWDPDSEISRLNRAPAGSTVVLSPWLDDCLARAEEIGAACGGAFDPTCEPLMRLWGFYRERGRLPSDAQIDSARALMGAYTHIRGTRSVVKRSDRASFDLGGIAKGYALDRAAEALKVSGIEDALMDLGGNIVCMGSPPGRHTWRVGIRDPQKKNRLLAVLETADRGIATSGSYERFVVIGGRRYGHIMDPVTGRPAEGLLSVTVVARDATTADGLSTALFVLGFDDARDLLGRRFPEVEAVFVLSPEGAGLTRVAASASLKSRIALSTDCEDAYSLEFF